MRDASGGSVVLSIIVVFIVFALGYMAFNVNYMKAFRMKNKVISVYEDFNGNCNSHCSDAIKTYANQIGYKFAQMSCHSGYTSKDDSYCIKTVDVAAKESSSSWASIKKGDVRLSDINGKYYYKIITKINISIPGIDWVFDNRVFYITGETKTFENAD